MQDESCEAGGQSKVTHGSASTNTSDDDKGMDEAHSSESDKMSAHELEVENGGGGEIGGGREKEIEGVMKAQEDGVLDDDNEHDPVDYGDESGEVLGEGTFDDNADNGSWDRGKSEDSEGEENCMVKLEEKLV